MQDELYSMFVPLIGVIAVILAAYWAVNWFSRKYKNAWGGRYVKVLERTMLAQDKSLVLIEVGGKVYLLGVGGQHIEKIDCFEPEGFTPPCEPDAKHDFDNIFTSLLKKMPPVGDKLEKSEKSREQEGL